MLYKNIYKAINKVYFNKNFVIHRCNLTIFGLSVSTTDKNSFYDVLKLKFTFSLNCRNALNKRLRAY